MHTELRIHADTDTQEEQRQLDENCGLVTDNLHRLQSDGAGAIPYPPAMIDIVCNAMGFDQNDGRFMHGVFKRHETGEATRPERLLLHLVMSLLTSKTIAADCAQTDESTSRQPDNRRTDSTDE